jgi:hypothetical protein
MNNGSSTMAADEFAGNGAEMQVSEFDERSFRYGFDVALDWASRTIKSAVEIGGMPEGAIATLEAVVGTLSESRGQAIELCVESARDAVSALRKAGGPDNG